VIGEPRATAITLGQLGSIVLEQGNFLDGAPMIEECLSELSRMGDRAAAMEAIGAVAEAMASVRPTDAARLWGAIQRQRELDGIRASPVAVARFKGRALQARAMLDDGMAFEKALEEGRSMSLPCAEQLAVLCLRDASHPAASPDGDAAGA
jgi:hypothetical protein